MFGWWGYLLMWAGPIYVMTYCADMCRVFCEHSTESGSDEVEVSERLVLFEPSKVEQLILSPMNMHHHIAHHLWPAIPYYNLPVATNLLKARAADSPHTKFKIIYRSSFFGYLFSYAQKCRA